MTPEHSDAMHAAGDKFAQGFAKLIAEAMDSLPGDINGDHVLAFLSDRTSIYGSGWQQHSKKWRVRSAAELIAVLKSEAMPPLPAQAKPTSSAKKR